MEVKKEIGFEDLKEMCWEGAVDTLNVVEENGKEEELMEYLKITLCGVLNDRIPTETEVNDELWFNEKEIFEYLGIEE